ncbi:MAG: CDP-alcohol phosphatidyltransferase family protein [Thermoleophilia bacterium]|jgi:CDP-diacylglycerol--glycerol-3-phosphate 3-phosphatidyltransferase|nr:CDP-alcohol phosphatidyltransferase family protein [Thermoleophilia bacterium]
MGVGPNTITVVGLLGSVAVAALVLNRWWVAAGVVFVLSAGMDMLDGSVARLSGRATPFGAFLDSTLDRLAEALVLGAIGVTLAEDGDMWAVGLCFLALTGSFLVSYTRARAEGLGVDSNKGGLMSRPERLVLIGAAIFFAPFDPVRQVAVAVLCGLTLLTVAQRLWHVHSVLAARENGRTTTQGGNPTP